MSCRNAETLYYDTTTVTDAVMPILDFGLQPERAYAPEGLGSGEVGFALHRAGIGD